MHHYPHHIGDFNSATRHLTRVERSLYRDLIELYYDSEQPIPANNFERLCRKVIASTTDEKEALQYVLDEFFVLEDQVYRNERCDKEIATYHANNSAKSRAGKASAAARKKKKAAKENKKESTDEHFSNSTAYTDMQHSSNQHEQKSTHVEQVLIPVQPQVQQNSTNQEPITSNQEPITKVMNTSAAVVGEALDSEWFPSNEVYEALRDFDCIPVEFIDNELLEFRIYWRDRGESRLSWNSKLLERVRGQWARKKYKWRQDHPDNSTFTENLSLIGKS